MGAKACRVTKDRAERGVGVGSNKGEIRDIWREGIKAQERGIR